MFVLIVFQRETFQNKNTDVIACEGALTINWLSSQLKNLRNGFKFGHLLRNILTKIIIVILIGLIRSYLTYLSKDFNEGDVGDDLFYGPSDSRWCWWWWEL